MSKTIFIIDDEKSVHTLLELRLSELGLETGHMYHLEEFFEKMKSQTCDLLILDMMLPEIDGISMLKEIRQRYSKEELPIVMYSSKTNLYDKQICLASGANDFVQKTADFNQLIDSIEKYS